MKGVELYRVFTREINETAISRVRSFVLASPVVLSSAFFFFDVEVTPKKKGIVFRLP